MENVSEPVWQRDLSGSGAAVGSADSRLSFSHELFIDLLDLSHAPFETEARFHPFTAGGAHTVGKVWILQNTDDRLG